MLWALSTIFLWQATVGKRLASTNQEDLRIDAQEQSENKTMSALEKPPKIQLSDDMRQTERMALAKTKGFKKIWPIQCDNNNAENQFGKKLGISTDGFACEPGEVSMFGRKLDNFIVKIMNPKWKNKGGASTFCCKSQCIHRDAARMKGSGCRKVKAKSLAEAAQVASMGSTPWEIRVAGKNLDVKTIKATPEQKARTPELIATVEVRMLGGTLEFGTGSSKLTDMGQKLLDNLGGPLAALLSMQLSGQQLGRNVKMMFCTHATTTAPSEQKVYHVDGADNLIERVDWHRKDVKPLPEARANVILESLRDQLTDDTVELGTAHAHYGGGRSGSILYKIYDAAVGTGVQCRKEDLDLFLTPSQPKVNPLAAE